MTALSLRGRLFFLIVPPLIAVAAVAGLVRFTLAERMSERLYDNTLLAVALTISRDVVLSEGDILAERLLESLVLSLGDPVYYRIAGPGGRFVTGYSNAPARPPGLVVERGVPAFFNSEVDGGKVRVVILEEFIAEPQFGGWVAVEVWQTVDQREALSLGLLYQSIGIMGVVIGAAALLVWFGIDRGLKPLNDLEDAVNSRSPDDLRRIQRAIPQEIRGLVGSMNGLFDRLKAAFAERDAFIADAAHQLRNPVAAIQAQAEALSGAIGTPDLPRRIERLSDSARHMSKITGQMLTLEKARLGFAGKGNDPTDLVALVRDLIARFAERYPDGRVSFSLSSSGPPREVPLDRLLVEEAVSNLIENAVDYGCPGGGTVATHVEFLDDCAAIRVSDDGPGLREADRNRVFDRFYRGTSAGSEGTGLGLAIAKSIADAHGGDVRFRNVSQGTTVEFTLGYGG